MKSASKSYKIQYLYYSSMGYTPYTSPLQVEAYPNLQGDMASVFPR